MPTTERKPWAETLNVVRQATRCAEVSSGLLEASELIFPARSGGILKRACSKAAFAESRLHSHSLSWQLVLVADIYGDATTENALLHGSHSKTRFHTITITEFGIWGIIIRWACLQNRRAMDRPGGDSFMFDFRWPAGGPLYQCHHKVTSILV